ncbi:helix-turn-helix domain-containing protein [Thermoflavimicrobium daqui]|uniref:helix-turn-helix domain-containing protein n=1 Tax=Thermoflavimicrobium daqui TaxID=2137476 RepID=UPI00143E01C7|nr:helix-turn-helix domain-containing protein [Thermoflavimicrobium daqui]
MSNPITEKLRLAREQKRLTLAQIEAHTKIPVRYILSIEKGDFAAIPPSVPLTLHIRSLAQLLEVDPAPILQAYQNTKRRAKPSPSSSQTTMIFQSAALPNTGNNSMNMGGTPANHGQTFLSRKETMKVRKLQEQSINSWQRWLFKWYVYVPIIAVFILVPIAIWLWNDSEQEAPTKASTTTPVSQASTTSPSPIVEQKKAEIQLVRAAETSQDETDVYEVKNVEQLRVKIEATGSVKISAHMGDKKGKVLLNKTLTAEESEEVTDQNGIFITVSSPKQVVLYINDIIIDTSKAKKAQNYQFKLSN